MPEVSVVIPFYKANNTVEEVLSALEGQSFPDFEVILVDDSPGERFAYRDREWNYDFMYLKNAENQGLASSLTRGAKAGDGEIIVTLHADCVPQSEMWLENLIAPMESNPDVGAVTSKVLIDFDDLSLVNKAFSYVYDMGDVAPTPGEEGTQEVRHVENKADAYRRDVLERAGYFSTKYKTSNEDTEMSERILRNGYSLFQSNDAKVEHVLTDNERQGTIGSHLRKGYEYTRQTIFLLLDYGTTYKLDAMAAVIASFLALYGHRGMAIAMLLSAVGGIWLPRLLLLSGILVTAVLLDSIILGVSAGLVYLFIKGGFHAAEYWRDFHRADLIIPIAVFTVLWEMAAAVGWLSGVISYLLQVKR